MHKFGPQASLVLVAVTAFWMSTLSGQEPPLQSEAETYRPTRVPDRIVLTITEQPTRSMAVTWRTDASVEVGLAEIAVADVGADFAKNAERVVAETVPLTTSLSNAHYHSAVFAELTPKTKYVYRVGDGVNWSEWNHFVTASEAPEPFSFVYFGDAQNDVKSHWSRVVRGAFADAPQARFFLHAGDLINRANEDGEWGQWHYAGGWLNATIPIVATPGNHEYAKNAAGPSALSGHWRPQFAFPQNGPPGLEETTYTFIYQGARFVSLNTNERLDEQAIWLDNVLAENPQPWTIVTMHHPIYSAKAGRDNPELRQKWQPVFDKHRVDLVLQGHDHAYARSGQMTFNDPEDGVQQQDTKSGTVYVVSVSGPKMYDLGWRPFMHRSSQGAQLYQIITVDGAQLRYEAKFATGVLYDAFTLEKQPDGPNRLTDQLPDIPERRGNP